MSLWSRDDVSLCHSGYSSRVYRWSWLSTSEQRTHTHSHALKDTHINIYLTEWRGLRLALRPQTQCVKSFFHPGDNYVNRRKVECVSVCVSAGWLRLCQFCQWPFMNNILLSAFFHVKRLNVGKICPTQGLSVKDLFICVCVRVLIFPRTLCLFQSDQVLVWCENHRRCAQVTTHPQWVHPANLHSLA